MNSGTFIFFGILDIALELLGIYTCFQLGLSLEGINPVIIMLFGSVALDVTKLLYVNFGFVLAYCITAATKHRFVQIINVLEAVILALSLILATYMGYVLFESRSPYHSNWFVGVFFLIYALIKALVFYAYSEGLKDMLQVIGWPYYVLPWNGYQPVLRVRDY